MDYKIKKISEVNNELLNHFYKLAFPLRYKTLINHWKWSYKIGQSEFEPLVLERDSKIIGMAGLIPEKLRFETSMHQGIWFTDFHILESYRNKGLGSFLTKEWMKICPIQITYCNEESLKIFKKFNWKNNKTIYRKIIPINFLKLIPVLKKINLNYKGNLFSRGKKIDDKEIDKVQPSNINIKDLTKLCKVEEWNLTNKNIFSIVRDEDWFKWRFIDCPYALEIFKFEFNNDLIVGHIFKINNEKRLNILYSYSQDQNNKIYDLVYYWCRNNNIDFIWTLNSEQKTIFKENLIDKFFFKKKVNFAYWSQDTKTFSHLEKGFSNSQGSDSDLESIQYQGE